MFNNIMSSFSLVLRLISCNLGLFNLLLVNETGEKCDHCGNKSVQEEFK